jgi:hypothetical protein
MKVEIKTFISPDISDLKSFAPADKRFFSFLLELIIGIKGEKGGDIFGIEVCTPKWLLENHQPLDILFGRHKLIVFEYNIDNIINSISLYLNSIAGDSWEEIASQIARIANWEFEDYKSD